VKISIRGGVYLGPWDGTWMSGQKEKSLFKYCIVWEGKGGGDKAPAE